jgi:hypothetical protein
MLTSLHQLGRDELLERFQSHYDRPAPTKLSRPLLELAIGYHLQANASSGLKPAIRQQLLSGRATPITPAPSPGTVLIREWQNQSHAVTVYADGVEYQGQRFRSLTEVAFRITGQKRSGPAFFGLKRAHG